MSAENNPSNTLENYLKGAPLNDELARMMQEQAEESEPESSEEGADKEQITSDDRENIRRLLTDPGWRVLLQLLDSQITRLEDAARANSLRDPFAHEKNGAMWAEASYARRARNSIVSLAEMEVAKLKAENGKVLDRQRRKREAAH
jgi:hypothetical protein